MGNKWFLWISLFFVSGILAQETQTPYKSKKIVASKDTISIEKVSINKAFFKVLDKNGIEVDSTSYNVDFKSGKIIFKEYFTSKDTLEVKYLTFPDFLTKTYSIYDEDKVVSNKAGQLFTIKNPNKSTFKPFDGLNTNGSITRGVTIGNNQNTVVNSNLDLQITGKLSDKVSLRASIQDSNIPLQDGGYSQKLDEFDQIFIELFSDKWNIRAGDLFLENRKASFLNFNKKVQGISSRFSFGSDENKTDIFASAALVRGQYARSQFTGQEGNQGPYKLRGNNGELYVLVISGSERVFVNGILLTRGENNDYIIDYNAGEVIFTSLFPITSEMRINVEYQYTDRNYTRFVTYTGAAHETEKWNIGGFLYSENDVKNQPLQQNLSEDQIAVLQNAGDDLSLMNAPSAYLDSYSENKVLYKKVLISGIEVFEYSNNPEDELYNVRFSLVGTNEGNYVLANNQAIGKIYEYIEPIAGIPQGNYEPIVRLIAPTKIQIATILGGYNPSEKTKVDFEIGVSNNDLNLYSDLDDKNNNGIAGKINAKQRLLSEKTTINAFADFQFIQQDFKTIERLFTIEFNRDWNLTTPLGNQSLLISGFDFNFNKNGFAKYQLEKLDFSENFSGTRHSVFGNYKHKNTSIFNQSSVMKSDGSYSNTKFIRNQTKAKYNFKKNWVGGSFNFEDNSEKLVETNQFSALSQKFSEYGAFVGRGDSTKVFVELGYLQRKNDSLQNGIIQRVNHSNSYYLNSQLIKTEKSNLSVFVKYRTLKYEDITKKDEPSLNSRIIYNDRFFDQLMQVSTTYENSSGTIAQQEFTYLEVESGQGVYTWNDYNNNGIQELQEFEIAPFADLAKYVRVFLPNQVFVRTHQNKFSQSLTFNLNQWQNKTGFLKFMSRFYNQTSFLIDRKIIRNEDNFDLNPFSNSDENLIGLNNSFRNSLFFNRGKQRHSITYNFLTNDSKNLLSVGSVENKAKSHQLQYQHLVHKTWLFTLLGKTIFSEAFSENYPSRNFQIEGFQAFPKVSYLFSKNASWDVFYEFQNKENQIGNSESLKQNRFGTSFTLNSEKGFSVNGEFSHYNNSFEGNALSAVGFQLLEGLQVGKNQTWRLLLQKNLTSYLDINVNYQGRKSETSKTIHTGNVQLRAFF
ncbi:hypothetical protein [uncultured Flavobacterium sp.]|uniref:hypothetical protein n=1 Tax=uncultured Flavobacterium sp. TaxID=165435 RepID=UPI0030EB5D1B|tara:strand:+ start:155729 stop:159130 length:3402 start_codon:yes stop_codon:yes gene_type:complete